MKAIIFAIGILYSLFGHSYQLPRDAVLEVYKESKLTADVVMIGDSITWIAPWSDLFANVNIANRGVSADSSAAILYRMDSILSTHPKKAFLMFGINDFLNHIPVDKAFDNYIKIINQLTQQNIETVVQSTLYCSTEKLPACYSINLQVNELNAKLKNYAMNNNLTFIDLNSILSTPKKGLMAKYSPDGIHVNIEAYKEWAKLIDDKINS
ncbi:GDSL-type esterase/lipase family protein [Legionella hackeliae]|nr:GDSL-type esterase/lipase family protein [Legionella hackeliae]KTD06641.1 GDSL-like Lipase/Acylhydrolase [Legionella hackeliae]